MAKGNWEPTSATVTSPNEGLVLSVAFDGPYPYVGDEDKAVLALKAHTESCLREWFSDEDSEVLGLVELWVNSLRISDEFNTSSPAIVLNWKIDASTAHLPSRAEFTPDISLLEEVISVIAGATKSFIYYDDSAYSYIVARVLLNTNLAVWLMQQRAVPELGDWQKVNFVSDFSAQLFTVQVKEVSKDDFQILLGLDGSVISVRPEDQWPDWHSILPEFHMNPVPMPIRESPYDKPWPTQDGLDRSRSFAIVNGNISDELIAEALKIPIEQVGAIVHRGHYQIGPAAQGSDFFIFELLTHAKEFHDLVGPFVDYVALAELVRRATRYSKSRQRQPIGPTSRAYSPPVLQNLCVLYVRRHFHPKANLDSNWEVLTSQWYDGYSSPSHPTSSLEYKVTVYGYKGNYEFRVRGDGEILALQLVSGKRIWQLKTSSLFEEETTHDPNIPE